MAIFYLLVIYSNRLLTTERTIFNLLLFAHCTSIGVVIYLEQGTTILEVSFVYLKIKLWKTDPLIKHMSSVVYFLAEVYMQDLLPKQQWLCTQFMFRPDALWDAGNADWDDERQNSAEQCRLGAFIDSWDVVFLLVLKFYQSVVVFGAIHHDGYQHLPGKLPPAWYMA